jgi:putative NADH-flavin reductase
LMQLTIFGASGRTGVHLAEQALAAGHDVVALMRNPAKLTLRHERLRVAQGELTDEAKVRSGTGTGDRVGSRISRADLAQFMLAQADDLRYARQELRISN